MCILARNKCRSLICEKPARSVRFMNVCSMPYSNLLAVRRREHNQRTSTVWLSLTSAKMAEIQGFILPQKRAKTLTVLSWPFEPSRQQTLKTTINEGVLSDSAPGAACVWRESEDQATLDTDIARTRWRDFNLNPRMAGTVPLPRTAQAR